MLHWEENISGYYTTTLMRAETTWNATARAAAYESLNSLFWHTSLKFKCQDASCITHNTHSAWTQVGRKYRGERCPFCSRCRELSWIMLFHFSQLANTRQTAKEVTQINKTLWQIIYWVIHPVCGTMMVHTCWGIHTATTGLQCDPLSLQVSVSQWLGRRHNWRWF